MWWFLIVDTANCYATGTGKRLWKARLGKHFSASLVTARGMAYFLADDGVLTIVRPGDKLHVVAKNEMLSKAGKAEEYFSASPAISDGQLFLRSSKYLYCIADLSGG